ncbi:MAG TPA: transglycosylase domain-containing protein [Thermoanaerobaculaceae bacterium]|nr:transglycosylase domain-containing protein [Thermoanaerobaculaceae bacterium]
MEADETMEPPASHPGAAGLRRTARRATLALAAFVALGLAASLPLLVPAWRLLERVTSRVPGEPSRLYARPLALRLGERADPRQVRAQLDALGYAADDGRGPLEVGRLRVSGGTLAVRLRRFPTARGIDPGGLLELRVVGGQVVGLRRNGVAVDEATLEPMLLAAYLDDDHRDCRRLPPGPLPETLVHAVLAAEDADFFRHPGISLGGIARAAWVDLRAGEAAQGGSTLTQQLVKNLALSGERTVWRKAREAALAVLLELRLSKLEILRAYLDSAYLGAHDGVSLIGVGAAARAYFGKDPDQLSLAEAATLAGMLSAPAHASPILHPDHARARRDWVLHRMAGLGWASADAAARAAAEPVATFPEPIAPLRAPYFVEAVRAEARERLPGATLERDGLALLATLGWRDQLAAEGAVGAELSRLERGTRRRGPAALQAAVVSLDPRDGALLAYVGGRDWSRSEFDRAGSARRQAGSAFKPVVYATAFALGRAAPSTILADEPLSVRSGGNLWEPRDDDGEFLGPVPARAALEESRNVPAARLGIDTGLDAVVGMGRAMGITAPLDPVPALSLGAFGLSPCELATVYATLAAGGVRPAVHGLEAALDANGAPVALAPLPERRRAMPEAVAFLLTDVLRGVLDRGTGRSARALGVGDALAGKTGTSNEGRDAWFAGYSPDRTTVVWVGRDDDGPTGLTGAQAALPIWARITIAVRPPGGYPPFAEPEGLVRAVIDPASGELATTRCPNVRTELFLAGNAPSATCQLHAGWLALPVSQPEGVTVERPGFLRRFFARLFGRRQRVV